MWQRRKGAAQTGRRQSCGGGGTGGQLACTYVPVIIVLCAESRQHFSTRWIQSPINWYSRGVAAAHFVPSQRATINTQRDHKPKEIGGFPSRSAEG